MAAVIKPGWSKPSAILFASESPPNEKAFAVALAEAAEFGAELIILHANDRPDVNAPKGSAIRGCDEANAQKHPLEPFAQRATDIGIHCKIVVRRGVAADLILTYLREQNIDRVVMGAHSPGPVGKLLVGSVAETVLRNANVPVCIVGPNVVEGTYRNFTSTAATHIHADAVAAGIQGASRVPSDIRRRGRSLQPVNDDHFQSFAPDLAGCQWQWHSTKLAPRAEIAAPTSMSWLSGSGSESVRGRRLPTMVWRWPLRKKRRGTKGRIDGDASVESNRFSPLLPMGPLIFTCYYTSGYASRRWNEAGVASIGLATEVGSYRPEI